MIRLFPSSCALPALCCLVVAACGSVVPGTVAQLSGLSPTTTDPAAMSVALDLPPGLSLQDPPGELRLTAVRGGVSRTAVAALQQAPDGSLGVAPGDVATFRDTQGEIAAWEEADPDGTSGSLSVQVNLCVVAPGPAADATVSVGVRLGEGAPVLPLIRDGAIAEVADGADLAALPACD